MPDTRTVVAAALDGGTALHVAAASGRNKHVSHDANCSVLLSSYL